MEVNTIADCQATQCHSKRVNGKPATLWLTAVDKICGRGQVPYNSGKITTQLISLDYFCVIQFLKCFEHVKFFIVNDDVKCIELMNAAIQRPPDPNSLVIPALYSQSE